MMLLTKTIRKALPPLYAQEHKGDAAIVHVKFFTPDSSWTWWATEYTPEPYDPVKGIFFGLVASHMEPEGGLGYWTLAQLEDARGPLGLPIERDTSWEPTTLGAIRATLRGQEVRA